MSATAQGGHSLAARLGIGPDMAVQEVGHDDDVDSDLLASVVEVTGHELVPDDSDDVVDVVLLWWREDDGDLVDALVDALSPLADNGVIWLLTPKAGREGHVEPSDVADAASTAGLSQTSSVSAASEWSGSRLVAPRSARASRR